jgi:hypothetical protein
MASSEGADAAADADASSELEADMRTQHEDGFPTMNPSEGTTTAHRANTNASWRSCCAPAPKVFATVLIIDALVIVVAVVAVVIIVVVAVVVIIVVVVVEFYQY